MVGINAAFLVAALMGSAFASTTFGERCSACQVSPSSAALCPGRPAAPGEIRPGCNVSSPGDGASRGG